MSLVYRIMYRVGFTPWDTREVPPELRALVEGADALDPGSAIDIGCGTGTQSLYLAAHGWRVTGIDDLEQPLRRARARSAAASSQRAA
jgi:2-polyprenyl-3-methyl-5-hydroxy-6-metoxy-1,4-benzoquinol methylase